MLDKDNCCEGRSVVPDDGEEVGEGLGEVVGADDGDGNKHCRCADRVYPARDVGKYGGDALERDAEGVHCRRACSGDAHDSQDDHAELAKLADRLKRSSNETSDAVGVVAKCPGVIHKRRVHESGTHDLEQAEGEEEAKVRVDEDFDLGYRGRHVGRVIGREGAP